jgi:DNA polymerase-3 subunit beta
MEVIFSRQELLSELQLVARATAVRSAIQSLSGILLSVENDRVELVATDTEIGLRSQVGAKVVAPGAVLIPGRLFVDILRVLEGAEVTLKSDQGQAQIEVTSGQSRFVVRGLSIEDFPRLPASRSEQMSVAAGPFASTIERVARAASRDETRPVLTGILVSVEGKRLRMVATDSYRLSVKETPLEGEVGEPFEVNVPARALQELTRVIADKQPEQISAGSEDNQIVFGAGDVVLSSRMIDGQFPNYRQLLPESYEHEIELNRAEFGAVVRRISLMAQRNAPLRLAFEDGAVKISAQTPDVGEAAETLPVNYKGEPLEIGFNPQFLQDGLDGVQGEQLKLKLISALRPGLIEAADEGEEEGKFLYLIMPVRLNV